jgi:serine protease AprX
VVIASAGNSGPEPMTIGVPGNTPYVVTVAAITGSYTPQDATDDRLANEHPEVFAGSNDLTLSGTTQAAAVVSGVVAQMLSVHPDLSADDVKCRLKSTGRMATGPDSDLLYSVFQQGSGLIDAYAAFHGDEAGNYVVMTSDGVLWNMTESGVEASAWVPQE